MRAIKRSLFTVLIVTGAGFATAVATLAVMVWLFFAYVAILALRSRIAEAQRVKSYRLKSLGQLSPPGTLDEFTHRVLILARIRKRSRSGGSISRG